jgi:hypothetical protein
MFPADEMSARAMRSDATVELFTTYMREGQTIFVLPSNMRDFGKNLLMISILKAAELKGYILETSIDKELPDKLFKTDEADFCAGYVYQAAQASVGQLVQGKSKFAKGQAAYQRSCVERVHKEARHLKRGGDSLLDERLSTMKSFTKAYWSVKARIGSLFKSIPKKSMGPLVSYLKSKQELEKLIHTSLSWDNRGVFRPEEVSYLNVRYNQAVSALSGFREQLSTPTERLATSFEESYNAVRRLVRAAESEVDTLINRRAAILFVPNAKKKRDVEWNKTKLLDKIATFTESAKISAFMPSTLPGIRLISAEYDVMVPIADGDLGTVYQFDPDNDTQSECLYSWNAYLSHFISNRD